VKREIPDMNCSRGPALTIFATVYYKACTQIPLRMSLMRFAAGCVILAGLNARCVPAQDSGGSVDKAPVFQERWKYIGDNQSSGTLAKGLFASTDKANVDSAMRKVADWRLQRVQAHWSQDCTFAAMYTGFMAAA